MTPFYNHKKMPTVEDRLLNSLLESVKAWSREDSIEKLRVMFSANISDYTKRRKMLLDKRKTKKVVKRKAIKVEEPTTTLPALEMDVKVKEEEPPLPESVMYEQQNNELYQEELLRQQLHAPPKEESSDEEGPEFYSQITSRNRQIMTVTREGRLKKPKREEDKKEPPVERKTNHRWAMRPGKRSRSKKYADDEDEEVKGDDVPKPAAGQPTAMPMAMPIAEPMAPYVAEANIPLDARSAPVYDLGPAESAQHYDFPPDYETFYLPMLQAS